MSEKQPKPSQYVIVQAKALKAVVTPALEELRKQTAALERIAAAVERRLGQ